MKKLTILLMFFTSVGYSQSNYRNNLLKWNRSDTVFQDVKYINLPSSLNWMLTYYDLYEKECFNDSVMFYNWIYYIANYNLDGHIEWVDTVYSEFPVNFHNIIMKHKTEKYKHKQPTFEGFMKYLKQQ